MKVFVVGAGTMGAGIAQTFAQNEIETKLYDSFEGFAQKGIDSIVARLEKQLEKGKITCEKMGSIKENLSVANGLNEASNYDLVIEAIIEDMRAKQDLFIQLDRICNKKTIFATNTSSLSITEIASCTDRPEKVIGMHFSNPAPVMPFMEIIRGFLCDEETRKTIFDISIQIGKDPVEVVEGPGFVCNRILIPMINEAIGIYADGLATVEDIDKAMKTGANHPMGPLALADLIGNDVVLAIMETLQREMGSCKYAPHPLLRKMCRAKLLGRKTGKGFYNY